MIKFFFFTVGIILARRLFWQPDETRCFTDSFPQNPVLTCSPFVVRLQPRLGGSGQIFERTKTCTVPPFPPFVHTGHAEPRNFLNGKVRKFLTWSEDGQNYLPLRSQFKRTSVNTWTGKAFEQFARRVKDYAPFISRTGVRLRVFPHFPSGRVQRAKRERAWKSLAWGDFHARSRFARSTIPEEKWATTRSLDLRKQ